MEEFQHIDPPTRPPIDPGRSRVRLGKQGCFWVIKNARRWNGQVTGSLLTYHGCQCL